MKVIMEEPDKPAYMTELGNDPESLQKVVGGGLIEPIGFLFDPKAVMVVNEVCPPIRRAAHDHSSGIRGRYEDRNFFLSFEMNVMKNTVTISLDDKKVQALKMYLSEKKTSLDEEISKYAEQLYGKVSAIAKAFIRGILAALWLSLYDILSYRTCAILSI